MKGSDNMESHPGTEYFDFLFLFDKASGNPRVHYFMVDPRHPTHIFPKMNAITMNVVKGICSYRVAVLDNRLYVLGGKNWDTGKHLSDMQRYDPDTNTWTRLSPMKSARCRFCAETVNGFLYAIGGETKKGRVTDSVERYDPEADTWSDVSKLPHPRADHASCTLRGKLFVSGGTGSLKQQSSNVFWVYDPETDSWSESDTEHETETGGSLKMPREREKHNMVPVGESTIFILTGRGYDHEMYMERDEGSVCQYNHLAPSSSPSSPSLTPQRLPTWDLSHPAIPRTRCYAGAAALGKNIWVFGGTSHSAASHVAKVEVYDTNRRRWRETFSLPAGNFTNVDLCRLSVPSNNSSFSFMDNYICNKWILW